MFMSECEVCVSECECAGNATLLILVLVFSISVKYGKSREQVCE